MTLRKRFTKHGNSYALIIDKALIDLLGMDVETPVELHSMDGHSLTIRQPAGADRDRLIDDAIKEIGVKYGDAMKRLAE